MVRSPCCDQTGNLRKGAWTKEEDERLINYIKRHGVGSWRSLPNAAGLLRCGKSCRLRWVNYLRPDLKRGNFTREEDDAIINLQKRIGNKWSTIAASLPGRTDNEIKNHWNTNLKRKLGNSGIPPPQSNDAININNKFKLEKKGGFYDPQLFGKSWPTSSSIRPLLKKSVCLCYTLGGYLNGETTCNKCDV